MNASNYALCVTTLALLPVSLLAQDCGFPAKTDLVGMGNIHTIYGRAWLSTTHQPILGDPQAGIRLEYENLAAEPAVLFVGVGATTDPLSSLPPIPLHVDLLQDHVALPFTTTFDSASTEFVFGVSADPVLCTGLPFYFQALILDLDDPSGVTGPLPLVATNRLDWTIGDLSPVVITEILQNPAVVSDANGEWFEIYNPTDTAFDLNGCEIHDDGSDSHFITGAPMLMPGDYYVLGRNGDMVTNGGVLVDYVYSGITLANGDDEVVIVHPTLGNLDRVAYDGGPIFPDPNGQSMFLSPAFLDAGANDFGGNWCDETAAKQIGEGTPGSANLSCSLFKKF